MIIRNDESDDASRTKLHDLLQHWDVRGCFFPTDNLAKMIGLESSQDLTKLKSNRFTDIDETVWTTLMVIAYLHIQMPDEYDEWKKVRVKAQLWVNAQLGDDQLGNNLFDTMVYAAKAVYRKNK